MDLPTEKAALNKQQPQALMRFRKRAAGAAFFFFKSF
jgi:hypothetical protein